MKINHDTRPNLSVKINQYEKVQRELHKLKFHLKMKRRLYDETEYRSVNDRVKQCESYFKQMKKSMIKEEADKILGRQVATSNRSKTQTSKKEAEEREIRVYNRSIMRQLVKKQENYQIKINSEKAQLSKGKYIVEYELYPTQKLKQRRENAQIKSYQKGSVEIRNERYVSQFQKNIKEKLDKLSLDGYEEIEQFDEIIKKNESQVVRTDKISKTNSLKLQSLTPHLFSNRKNNEIKGNTSNCNPSHEVQSYRYDSLRSKKDRCRTQLSERQKQQISNVTQHKTMNNNEKNKILSNFYQKYASHQKYGDATALDLMCVATLARADLLLKQI